MGGSSLDHSLSPAPLVTVATASSIQQTTLTELLHIYDHSEGQNRVLPTDLRVEVIGWLLLARCDWLLRGFPLMRAPASGGRDAGRVIKYGAAIRMEERLPCQMKFTKKKKKKWFTHK